jgi:hypothetical protein
LIGLGYIGVDLVLDKELNERPGLNIQIANRAGLLPRLQLVEKHHHKLTNIEERLAFSKEHFGMST